MNTVIKLILFITVAGIAVVVGYKIFHSLNERIKESATGKQLLVNTILLFIVCAFLFVSAVALLIMLYDWMSTVE
jgi:uncharacterized membrane protein